MMFLQLPAGPKIVAKCYSQAFIYLTYKHFYCSNVILWANVRREDQKDTHFLISFQWMFGIAITSGTDSVLLSHVATGSGWLSLSLSGMRVQGLVTLWGLGLFNEVVICHKEDHPWIPSSLCQVALFLNFLVSLIKMALIEPPPPFLRMVCPI